MALHPDFPRSPYVILPPDRDEVKDWRDKGYAGATSTAKTQSTSFVRASISFPPDLYETLEEIAKQKKVFLAWVVRDAAEKYIAGEAKDGRGASVPDNSAQRSARRIDR